MKRNYTSKANVGRLCDAIKRGRESLEYFRVQRREAVRQYVGKHWSEDGSAEYVPINLLALYVEIVARNLVAKNPRMMLSTFNQSGTRAVAVMEQWLNDTIENSDVAHTLHRIAVDALFSIGIAKVALATTADSSLGGYATLAGEPFLDRVDLDDFVYDVFARDFSEAGFVGHRYRVPLDAARLMYRKDLEPTEPRDYNNEGDERIGVMGRGQFGQRDEYEPHIDLWEVYCPRHRSVKTFRSDETGTPMPEVSGLPLMEQEWVGPDSGPYHFLCFGVVPGNAMPKAPVQDLIDLHVSVNSIARKSIQQAIRQRRITLLSGALSDSEKTAIANSRNGEVLQVSSLQGVMPVDLDGVNAPNAVFGQQLSDIFSRMAGNLDMLGGLAPQSKTAAQDKMLNENSSQKMSDMQDTTITFVSSVMKAMSWYHWLDPFRVRSSRYSPGGVEDGAIMRNVGPMDRMRVPWEELRVRIDPYSIRHSTPESRVTALNSVMQQIVMPLFPLLQQQGIGPDMAVLLEKYAKYLDMPDLTEVLKAVPPPAPTQGGDGGDGVSPTSMQPNGGEYVRRSLGADSAGAKEAGFANEMMAAGEPSASGGGATMY